MTTDARHDVGSGRRLWIAACERWIALERGWQATLLGLCVVGGYALGQGL